MVSRATTSLFLQTCIAMVHITLIVSQSSIDEICYPSDFERVASECNEQTGVRTVNYVQRRNCSTPFPTPDAYSESCSCTPEDYVADYSTNTTSNECQLTYTPTNCTGGAETQPVVVDETFCSIEDKPCKEEDVRSTYLQCDETTKKVKIVYYFDSQCNSLSPGSTKLPPNTLVPCGLQCGAGSLLVGKKCALCPNGTFSIGGGTRLEGFTKLDNSTFKTSCTYHTANGTEVCDPWRVEGGALKVGPFDSPNEYFQDECAQDQSLKCHNGVKAILSMNTKLVRDGYVRFKYTVDAEVSYDGLQFFVDDTTVPLMPLISYQYSVTEIRFSLTSGYHVLQWAFVKDEKWTRGKDSAAITLIEIDGTDFNNRECTPCPAGYFSGEGASECTPCPLDTFSNTTGTIQCQNCTDGFYSLNEPRTECIARPPCDLSKDVTVSFSPCIANRNVRAKKYSWLAPQICQETSDDQLPEAELIPCAECPSGQVSTVDTVKGIVVCSLCPQGEARNESQAACHGCEPGQAAVRQLSLAHFAYVQGRLPEGFLTGCSGQCGGDGWRAVNDVFDSGSGHGNTVSVWLSLNVTLEMDGFVWYNFSVDIPPEDTQRGLFFYIDDNLVDDVEGADYEETSDVTTEPQISGPWLLAAGSHSLMWLYIKLNADPEMKTRDSVVLYEIQVKGEVRGGASTCEDVPEGSELSSGGSAWTDCPAGMFGLGGNTTCQPCPTNTYNPKPKGGADACIPCGPGTSSNPNSTECVIGDATEPASFCVYTSPITDTEVDGSETTTSPTLYDLSPFDRLHPKSMFGPVFENASSPQREDGPAYFFSVCRKTMDNNSCVDNLGNALNTYGCRLWGLSTIGGRRRPAHSLGESVSLYPLGNGGADLSRRGLVMSLEGEKCPFAAGPRVTNITFVCDADSGYGTPEAWTAEGYSRVFDKDAAAPWLSREGVLLPVEQKDFCSYSLVWYSAYACPLCGERDYESVHVMGCANNLQTVFQYKQPKLCQSNPLAPLPSGIPCPVCTVEDFTEEIQNCVDSEGLQNTTYRWNQPQICNPNLPDSVKLPADVLAGPCNQYVTVISRAALNRWEILGIAASGLLVIVLSIVSIVMYLRSRKIYSEYSKLLNSEKPGDFVLEEGGMNGTSLDDDDDDDFLYDGGNSSAVK